MGIENFLNQAILRDGDIETVLKGGISSSLFKSKKEKKAFEFILDYHKNFNGIPASSTVKAKIGWVEDKGMLPEPVGFFVKEMKNRELYNAVVDGHGDITKAIKERDPMEAKRLLSVLNSSISGLGDEQSTIIFRDAFDPTAISERMARYERVKAMGGVDGIPTPWESLDDVTFGWHPEELILVCGRTGTGKSWILLQCAKKAWEEGKKVLFVTFEMSESAIGRRLDAMVSGAPFGQLRKGELDAFKEDDYKTAMKKYEGSNRFVVMSGAWASTTEQLAVVINQVKPDFVVIDGIYMMSDGMKTPEPWKKVQNIADQVKMLAIKTGLPIMASAQFNKNVNLKKMIAGTEAIGGSDRLGQNSDVVIGLFTNDDMRDEKALMMRLLKVREGEMKSIKLEFDFDAMKFGEKCVISNGKPKNSGSSGQNSDDGDVPEDDTVDYD